MAYVEAPPHVGSTATFRLRAKLNGVTWEFTSATLVLTDPGGNESAAVNFSVSGGVGSYTSAVGVLDEAGTWYARATATDGTVTKVYRREFEVLPQ